MKNNLLDKITMKSSKRPISRFNLSHDVSTTFGFGEVSPIFCKQMDAHSKLVMSSENLVRLAPMLRPTFGRISLQTWSRFVPMTDVMPCYAEFLTKTRFNYSSLTFTPVRIPAISLGFLSAMCLVGAKLSLYRIAVNSAQVQYECPFRGSTESTNLTDVLKTWFGGSGWRTTGGNNDFGLVSTYFNLSASVILGQSFGTSVNDYPTLKIPCANSDSIFAVGTDYNVEVSINEADIIVERTDSVNNESWAFAFKLSAFGKRIRKILLGLGYQINLDSKQPVSILPLLGYYIAYFNTFGIEQWRNYQDTACSKFIQTSLSNYGLYYNEILDDNPTMMSYFCKFIMELGNCFYTENQDFVSAHIQNVENATHSFSQVGGFIDAGAVGATIDVASSAIYANQGVAETTAGSNAHAKIYRQVHSELDAKLLQKLYKCTNRDSVLGQKVAKQLEALGYGEWMKANPSTFIGHTSTIIRISDVISSSDTYQNGQGALLGDFGAKGVGYNENGVQKFTASVPGMWITFACIVPDSGYCQAVQGELLSVDPMTVYNPEFDGLGVEASQKLLVCGSADRSSSTPASDGTLDATFGFVPRYTSLKVKPNIMSGDFSLRSTRNSFLPYTLDKFMEVNSVDAEDKGIISGFRVFTGATSFNPALLPLANAEIWRTPTKYGYLNNFNRIFALVGDNAKNPRHWDAVLNMSEYFQLTYTDYDNFMCHMVNNVQFYSHMLKIEDSFETREDGNNGSADMVVSKA